MSRRATGKAPIIQLSDLREASRPRLEGIARCIACRHEWRAGVDGHDPLVWLECPECHLQRGRLAFPVEHEGPHYACKCGNDLFYIMPGRAYCPHCGAWHEGLI